MLMQLVGLTTDDGADAKGYAALVSEFSDYSRLCVAPAVGVSSLGTAAIDHLVETTVGKDLLVSGSGAIGRVISGSAAIAARELVKELKAIPGDRRRRPPLIIVGVNHGPNVGEYLLHSGTFGAALVASWLGYTAIAASLDDVYSVDESNPGEMRFGYAARAVRLLSAIVDAECPRGCLVNLNVPNTIEVGTTRAVAAQTHAGARAKQTETESQLLARGLMVVSVLKRNSLAADLAISRSVAASLSQSWCNAPG